MEEKGDFIRKLLIVAFKRKKTFFITSILTVVIVVIGSLLMSPVYESSSKLLLKQGRFAYKSTQIDKDDIDTEIAILRSRPLAEKVVKILELDKLEDVSVLKKLFGLIKSFIPRTESRLNPEVDAKFEQTIDSLLKHIDINKIENSSFVNITYASKYPEIAQNVVNAFARFAAERHAEVYRQEEAYRFFDKEAQRIAKRIKVLEKKLLSFKKRASILSVAESSKEASPNAPSGLAYRTSPCQSACQPG